MTKTEFLLDFMKGADAVDVGLGDGCSMLLMRWATFPPLGTPDNEVLHFQFTDDEGLGYFITLTEGGINEGFWEEGVFNCQDSEGDLTQLTLYQMQRIVPTHHMKELQ